MAASEKSLSLAPTVQCLYSILFLIIVYTLRSIVIIHMLILNSFLFLRYLDNNNLSCIETGLLDKASQLQIVSLNDNNISHLPANLFDQIEDLRILRLSDNKLQCDCNMSWLARWLKVYIIVIR